jgi:hypothetical protein
LVSLDIYYRFGLDATGLSLAPNFHPFWGPVLFVRHPLIIYTTICGNTLHQVAYACLSTTLLLTVLVSILAARFAEINSHAIEEYMFREAVEIFEGLLLAIVHEVELKVLYPGIKSDAIFNYWPPVNLLALVILTPIRLVMSPRRFHSLNVLCTRKFLHRFYIHTTT